MSLETATYINGLDVNNPTSGDPKSQGDDHLRLVKSTIKATFPSVTGAVTLTHTQINRATGNMRSLSGINAPSTLVAADTGKAFGVNTAGAITLPVANTCTSGDVIELLSNINGVTVIAQGGNNLYVGSAIPGSVSIDNGKSARLITDALNWYLIGGLR